MTGRYTDPHEHLPRSAENETTKDLLWFNTTRGRWEVASPTLVITGVDHGVLGGLLDDDHLQYLLIDGTRAMTGGLRGFAGTALLPGYAFDGDLDTGMWHPIADELAFSTNGSEKVRVDSAGNVGIGITNPLRRFEVETTGTSIIAHFKRTDGGSGYIAFSDNVTTGVPFVAAGAVGDDFFIRAGNVERMRIDSAGNVAIGSTPLAAYALRVNASLGSSGGVWVPNVGTDDWGLVFSGGTNPASGIGMHGANGSRLLLRDGATIDILLTTASHSYINTGFNVGIGITSPGHLLDVSGTINGNFYRLGGQGALQNVGTFLSLGESGFWQTFKISTNAVERLRIDSSGRVIIAVGIRNAAGIASGPSYAFDGDPDTGLWNPTANELAWSTGGAEKMRLDASGYLGLGLGGGTATYMLHIKEVAAGNCIRLEGGGAFGSGGRILFGDATRAFIEEDIDDLLHIFAFLGVRIMGTATTTRHGVGTLTPQSTWEIAGSRGTTVVAKTATYTAADEDVILCDATTGAITINLPAAAGVAGRVYHIKKTDNSANAVTVDGSGAETIDGALTQVITAQYDCIEVVSDGTNWYII